MDSPASSILTASSVVQRRKVAELLLAAAADSASTTNINTSIKSISTDSSSASIPLMADRTVHIKTKITCTIGPKTQDVRALSRLIDAGMNVARMNFSHGSQDFHQRTVDNLRAACDSFPGVGRKRLIGLLLDTKGPEIRTGKVEGGKLVVIRAGQEFSFWCQPAEQDPSTCAVLGNQLGVPVMYERMPHVVSVGSQIMVDDGLLSFRVKAIDGATILTVAENAGKHPNYNMCSSVGELGDTKGVNLPGCPVDLPALTAKDRRDIAFGIKNNIDFIAASFVRSAADIDHIRSFLIETLRCTDAQLPWIIAKIENQQGLDNFDEILGTADGIMVARGDLGVEVPVEQVFRWQKWMIAKCNRVGKPCITATQMLESMITNPRPTRAEATDIANAVLDGSDSVMLSGETAKGSYPIRSVDMMARICRVAEAEINYAEVYASLRKHIPLPLSTHEAIAAAAVKTAWEVQATCIIALTETGRMALTFARHRPIPPVLAITSNAGAARKMQLLRGIYPLLVSSTLGTTNIIMHALRLAIADGITAPQDTIVFTAGVIEGATGTTNTMRVMRCPAVEELPPVDEVQTFFLAPISRRNSIALALE